MTRVFRLGSLRVVTALFLVALATLTALVSRNSTAERSAKRRTGPPLALTM